MKNKVKTRVYIAGHNGMVGSAILRYLSKSPNYEIITRSRKELNLLSQKDVYNFFSSEKIDQVYLAAAKVGGIHANNTYPADFIYQNLMIQSNIIHSAHLSNIQKLLFLGSSCIYPVLAKQPLSESSLLSGKLEPTNEPYAIAKIAGIKLCESYNRQHKRDYRSVMPTNLYGPNDYFHNENSHVIPGLIKRFHDAKKNNSKKVIAWGTGSPMREFMHVDDMASACIFLMELKKRIYDSHVDPMLSHVNIGTGEDHSIKYLIEIIAKIIGFKGDIEFDSSKPDGAPKKLMNVEKLKELGWSHNINLEEGLRNTYEWFLANIDTYRN